MKKLGLIVNPIAGMGGRVGLKGTDGRDVLRRAIMLGARPVAPDRAIAALKNLAQVKNLVRIVTCSHEMGEDEARMCGFDPQVIHHVRSGETTAADTKEAAYKMKRDGVDLILFVGGDGTARDIYEVVGGDVPILGAPAGVKVYSATFANTPELAGIVAARFLTEGLPVREAEVMDIDEEAFRKNQLMSELKGYAKVPYEPVMMQAAKESSTGFDLADQKAIARWMVDLMERGRMYILGPGTTTRAVAEELGIYNSSLLGVDLIMDHKLVARDVNECQILKEIENIPAAIIVSPIGKQGFIFGRGNQQISARVIRKVGKKNIVVVATPHKLSTISTLRVDTGDPELDDELQGYIPVVVGYLQTKMVKVTN